MWISTFFKDLSWFFQNFLSFLCSVLRVSPDTDPSRRDRSVSVPAESAAETATVNHGTEWSCGIIFSENPSQWWSRGRKAVARTSKQFSRVCNCSSISHLCLYILHAFIVHLYMLDISCAQLTYMLRLFVCSHLCLTKRAMWHLNS